MAHGTIQSAANAGKQAALQCGFLDWWLDQIPEDGGKSKVMSTASTSFMPSSEASVKSTSTFVAFTTEEPMGDSPYEKFAGGHRDAMYLSPGSSPKSVSSTCTDVNDLALMNEDEHEHEHA
eukprot:GFYU01033942.1.p2 GENE.GFYU01033942.1~~GFYU01033942.1.p2  ORF type:complete len:121 (-),score=19.11 GFYU01033942.1:123-485(-)